MGQLVDRDDEHLRLLRIGYYIQAGMVAFFSLFALLYVFLGAVFFSGVIPANQRGAFEPRQFGLIFAGIGVALFAIGVAFALLSWLTAQYLRDRRHWTFCIVIACLTCLQFPWGTALGVLTILVLSRPEVKALFEPAHP